METYVYAGLASGFSTSAAETAIFFSIMAVALILWIGTSIHRVRLENRSRDNQAEAYFHHLLETRGLSASEKDLLLRMAACMRNRRERYLLLQDHRTFNQIAATILESDETASRADISSLRMSLGFAGEPTGSGPRSTTELTPGELVHIRRPNREPLPARVMGHERSYMRVRIEAEKNPFSAGQAVQVIYRNSAGIFSFGSTVFRHRDKDLELSHSEGARRLQRRQHYRRTFTWSVTIAPRHDPEESIKSEFRELGGNGATVLNPKGRFTSGEEVELTFDPGGEGEDTISLYGIIERTSEEDSLVHIRFFGMPESERDRIYRLLFNQ